MKVRLGTTPDSWGVWFADEPRQVHWSRFLDEVAAAGYQWIELGPVGYLPLEHEERLRAELEDRSLSVIAGTIIHNLADPAAWSTIEGEVKVLGPALAGLQARYLVLIDAPYTDLFTGEKVGESHLRTDDWDRLIETSHRLADLIAPLGLGLVFHPHAQTRIESEEQIEELLSRTYPTKVGLCLDVGHHAYLGGDPVAFMRNHAERIPYLHLKSVDPRIARMVEAGQIPFASAVARGIFCEPDRGAVDFVAFRDVLAHLEYDGWAMVEQDMFPVPPEVPLPVAIRTRQYFEGVGFSSR